MPIDYLFVEGKMDTLLLNAIKEEDGQMFTIQDKGSKDGLRSKVVEARKEQKERLGVNYRDKIFYLRDRDFDFDVPPGIKIPQSILHERSVIGWHWCRHEIENYLLEPAILSQFLSDVSMSVISIADVEEKLRQAALLIRSYQIARWTVGSSKRRALLPPPNDLKTRPVNLKEFKIPIDLGRHSNYRWVYSSTRNFQKRVQKTLIKSKISKRLKKFEQDFNEGNFSDIQWILHMFSGKDLFAAIFPWLSHFGMPSSRVSIQKVADWLSENPNEALKHLEEWRELMNIIRGI